MKMISSTSMTSTSGTTLISASELATRRLRLRPPETSSAVCTFGTLGEVPFRDVQKLHRKVVHLRSQDLHAVRQGVIEVDRGNRCHEPGCRSHERIRDRP